MYILRVARLPGAAVCYGTLTVQRVTVQCDTVHRYSTACSSTPLQYGVFQYTVTVRRVTVHRYSTV